MPHPHVKMLLAMSEYHVANLRWLLAVAHYGFPDKTKTGDTWPVARGLATGDWCGELLREVEQFMIDHGIPPHRANTTLDPDHYPLRGWWNGRKSADVAREGYHGQSNERRTFWAEEPK